MQYGYKNIHHAAFEPLIRPYVVPIAVMIVSMMSKISFVYE